MDFSIFNGKTRYGVEISPTGRATCKGTCKQLIEKGEARFYEELRSNDGAETFKSCRHLECITTKPMEHALESSGGKIDKLPGYSNLSSYDKKLLIEAMNIALTTGKSKYLLENGVKRKKKKATEEEEEFPEAPSTTKKQRGGSKVRMVEDYSGDEHHDEHVPDLEFKREQDTTVKVEPSRAMKYAQDVKQEDGQPVRRSGRLRSRTNYTQYYPN